MRSGLKKALLPSFTLQEMAKFERIVHATGYVLATEKEINQKMREEYKRGKDDAYASLTTITHKYEDE